MPPRHRARAGRCRAGWPRSPSTARSPPSPFRCGPSTVPGSARRWAACACWCPEHTARFVSQLHATEGWHEALGLPLSVNAPIDAVTRMVTQSLESEARNLGSELVHIRGLVPWLSTVPVVAFLLLTRWHRFRKSTSRVLPTPHLQWRGNEFLGNLNSLLAAYTRAQALSAMIVGAMCWIGFAALGLPYPGTLALAAGFLEMIPLAGPLVVAVVTTAVAPDRVLAILGFLAGAAAAAGLRHLSAADQPRAAPSSAGHRRRAVGWRCGRRTGRRLPRRAAGRHHAGDAPALARVPGDRGAGRRGRAPQRRACEPNPPKTYSPVERIRSGRRPDRHATSAVVHRWQRS